MDIIEKEKMEQEAFDTIQRKFTSANSVDVERATIKKEEWKMATLYISRMEREKFKCSC